MPSAELTTEIDAPLDVVYRVITDYESYPEFLSEMRNVHCLERKKGKARVSFSLRLIKEFNYVLEFTEKSPSSLKWKLVGGELFKVNEGEWKLRRGKDSRSTNATYHLSVELSLAIPRLIEKQLLEQTLPKTVERFKERAERTYLYE